MSFLANLRNTMGDGMPQFPPDNLGQLGENIGYAAERQELHQPHLAQYCDAWAQQVEKLRESDLQALEELQGHSREILEERGSIYTDIAEALRDVAEDVRSQDWATMGKTHTLFSSLLAELVANIEDLNQWLTSDEHRCMGCGWASRPPKPVACPSCKVRCLRPVRRPKRGDTKFANQNELQARLFDAIVTVLEGRVDVCYVDGPLKALEAHYAKALAGLMRADQADPHIVALKPHLEKSMACMETVRRGIDEFDAQLLEDGWSGLFASESATTVTYNEVMGIESPRASSSFDWLILSNEDD